MVVLVLFALEPNFYLMTAIIVALAASMFTNLKFVHPVRTERWRWITLPVALAWVVFAGRAAWVDFAPGELAHWGLAITSIYLLVAGVAQQMLPMRGGDA
jgi:phosphatidylcholine synthase